ncbi:Odorant receptor 91, partial [Halyomorpha halys]
MDPPRFADHYRPLLGWLRTCGLSTPWGEKPSFALGVIITCYNTLLVIMVCYTLLLYFYSILKNSIPFDELCLLGVGFGLYGCNVAVTLYLFLFQGKLKVIINKIDSIAATIQQNEIGGSEFLQEMYKKHAKLMVVLANNSIYFGYLTPMIFCLSVPTMDWYAGNYRANLPIQIDAPYDYHIPLVYELMVLLLSCCLAVSTTKKAATDCLFMSLFNIQITFLKYLSITKSYIQDDFNSTNKTFSKRKLIIWIRLHQQVN